MEIVMMKCSFDFVKPFINRTFKKKGPSTNYCINNLNKKYFSTSWSILENAHELFVCELLIFKILFIFQQLGGKIPADDQGINYSIYSWGYMSSIQERHWHKPKQQE